VTKSIKIYNESNLSDSEAVLLCSELLLKPDLSDNEFQHPSRVTIKYIRASIGAHEFYVKGGAE
jgi:hypothetical protein